MMCPKVLQSVVRFMVQVVHGLILLENSRYIALHFVYEYVYTFYSGPVRNVPFIMQVLAL